MSHYTWTFDVRNTIIDYPSPPHNGNPGDDAATESFYDHVNAMCFLLDGMPYSVVYGPAHEFALAILDKLAHCSPGTLRRVLGIELPAKIREEMEHVRDEAGSDRVNMRLFYESMIPSGHTPEYMVYRHFEELWDFDDARDKRVCMPFVRIQKGRLDEIPAPDMDRHIEEMKMYTLFDIYTKSIKRYPDLAKAVQFGKDIGALGMDRTDLRVWGPGNNRRCKAAGGGCEPNTGTWCNIDSNGNCTTGTM